MVKYCLQCDFFQPCQYFVTFNHADTSRPSLFILIFDWCVIHWLHKLQFVHTPTEGQQGCFYIVITVDEPVSSSSMGSSLQFFTKKKSSNKPNYFGCCFGKIPGFKLVWVQIPILLFFSLVTHLLSLSLSCFICKCAIIISQLLGVNEIPNIV